ncbi:MAG: hypothetical protein AAFN08_06015 [Cyanobacteria bacterium J06559_3]
MKPLEVLNYQRIVLKVIGLGRSPSTLLAWAYALRGLAWKLEQTAYELREYEADEVL